MVSPRTQNTVRKDLPFPFYLGGDPRQVCGVVALTDLLVYCGDHYDS